MDQSFIQSLKLRARSRRAKIGIGIQKPSSDLISGLQALGEYADLVLVGGPFSDFEGSNLCFIESEEPWNLLTGLLAGGEIEGAVRGNISASKTMKSIARQFSVRVRRMALIDLGFWSFFLGPVGIDEGENIPDKLGLVLAGANYLKDIGISPRISVLSGGRMEDVGRSERVDRSLAEGEFIAARAKDSGFEAKHSGILIESCRGDDLILAPDGISGNLVFRTLLYICGANAQGAPILMDKVFVDSSRGRGDYLGPVTLASALVSFREESEV